MVKIKWDEQALIELKKIFQYISQDSQQNAQKVIAEIVSITRSLDQHPLRFPPDKYKDNNDGSYRAFVKFKYRVAYKVLENEIIILRVRSEKQEPHSY